MIMYTTWFGTFLYENDVQVASKLFPRDVREIEVRMKAVAAGEILSEERELAQGKDRFLVVDSRLTRRRTGGRGDAVNST
jgi:hypothetical protein